MSYCQDEAVTGYTKPCVAEAGGCVATRSRWVAADSVVGRRRSLHLDSSRAPVSVLDPERHGVADGHVSGCGSFVEEYVLERRCPGDESEPFPWMEKANATP